MISLGDSFISGEAGRWQGNSSSPAGSRHGTDRAAYDCNADETSCRYDPTRVYGASYQNGCNRSDSAEITHLGLVRVGGHNVSVARAHRVNIACSGATTADVVTNTFKGEPPQVKQLAAYAAKDDVKLIVLSIGGNDIQFSDIIKECAIDYNVYRHCNTKLRPQMPGRIATMKNAVRATVAKIRQVMSAAGYATTDYRFVLQSYPSPIPNGADNRYPETYARTSTGGCPFYNDDSDWAHDEVVPAIATALRELTQESGAHLDFLNMPGAIAGHEVCAKGVQQSAAGNLLTNPLPAADSEWARFVSGLAQGQVQESMHPNYFGQQVLGGCLRSLAASDQRQYACRRS